MKTSITSKITLVALFTVFLSFLPKSLGAQINPPYIIWNHQLCSATVIWDIYDNVTCTSCVSGVITLSPQGTPGDSYTLTAADFGSCAPGCNLIVTVTDIGGNTAGLPVSADVSNPGPALPSFTGCGGPGSHLNWNTSQCDINP